MKRIPKILAASLLLAAGLTVVSAGPALAATPTCTSWTTYNTSFSDDYVIHVPSAGYQTGRVNCLLRQGNASGAVTVLQRAMRYCYDQNVAIDGEYGPQTRSAVLWFQRRTNGNYGVGIAEDGIYGPETQDYVAFPVWRWPANTRTNWCEHSQVI